MGYAYFKLGTAYNRLEPVPGCRKQLYESDQVHCQNSPCSTTTWRYRTENSGRTEEEIAALKKAISIRPTLLHRPFQSRHGLSEDRPARRGHETIQRTQETGRRHCRNLKKRDRCEEEIEHETNDHCSVFSLDAPAGDALAVAAEMMHCTECGMMVGTRLQIHFPDRCRRTSRFPSATSATCWFI